MSGKNTLVEALRSAAGDPPKKKSDPPAKKKVAPITLPAGDVHDNRVRDKVQPLVNTYAQYVASPLYLARLKGMQVPDAEQVQAGRLDLLSQVQPRSVAEGKEHLMYYGGKPVLEANPATPRYTLMHELGHTFTNGAGGQAFYGETPRTATPQGMSAVEGWQFVNRANLPEALHKAAYDKWQQGASGGKYASFSNEPVLAVKPGDMDEHGVSTAEMKGDLEALRLLMLDNGITTQYGEPLDAEKMKRFMQKTNLHKEEHVERLLKNFSPEDLIDLNNKIAARKPVGGPGPTIA